MGLDGSMSITQEAGRKQAGQRELVLLEYGLGHNNMIGIPAGLNSYVFRCANATMLQQAYERTSDLTKEGRAIFRPID